MNKLFQLKEWLLVADVARHLSIVYSEDVTEVDVLRLALGGQMRLSVYLANYAEAHPAEMTSIPIEMKDLPGLTFTTDQILRVQCDEIVHVSGVLDLPMIGSERLDVEDRCHLLLNGKGLEQAFGQNVLVEDDGQLYQILTRFADPIFVQIDGSEGHEEKRRRINEQSYCAAPRLPEDSILVVRTEALREFEQSINASPSIEKPLTTSERNSLLTIIAALCDESGIRHQDRGAANRISSLTQGIGAAVSEDTVLRALKKIPDALESRMK